MTAKIFPIIFVVLGLCGCASNDSQNSGDAASPAAVAASDNDLVRLAKGWWGLSPDEFIAKSGLAPGEYSRGPHPADPNTTVVFPLVDKWEPPQLPPLEFDFLDGKGLVKISGFFRQNEGQAAVLAAMVERYGPYQNSSSALNMSAYGWEIDGSLLDVRSILFDIVPATSP